MTMSPLPTARRAGLPHDEQVLIQLLAEVARMQQLIYDALAGFGPVEAGQVVTHPRFLPNVTAAERRVLIELCRPLWGEDGLPVAASNEQIADALCLSLACVKSHLRSLFGKFAIGDLPQNRKRAALARRAIQLGVVHRAHSVSRT